MGVGTWDQLCERAATEGARSVLVRLGHELGIACAAGGVVTAEHHPLGVASGLLQAHRALSHRSLLLNRRRCRRQRPPRPPRGVCRISQKSVVKILLRLTTC